MVNSNEAIDRMAFYFVYVVKILLNQTCLIVIEYERLPFSRHVAELSNIMATCRNYLLSRFPNIFPKALGMSIEKLPK